MDGCCECDLDHQKDDGGGCATIKIGRSGTPWCQCIGDQVYRGHFLCSFRPLFRALVAYHMER